MSDLFARAVETQYEGILAVTELPKGEHGIVIDARTPHETIKRGVSTQSMTLSRSTALQLHDLLHEYMTYLMTVQNEGNV